MNFIYNKKENILFTMEGDFFLKNADFWNEISFYKETNLLLIKVQLFFIKMSSFSTEKGA